MLALDGIRGFGRFRSSKKILAENPNCRLELTFWYGGHGIRPLLGVRATQAPSPELIEQAVGEIASYGIETVFTEAIPQELAAPFFASGFVVTQELVLMHRWLGFRSTLHKPHRPRVPVEIVRARRSRYEELAAIDIRAFPAFWSLGAKGIEDAQRATKTSYTYVAELDNPLATSATSESHRRMAVGYAIVGIDGRTAYLQRLAVDPLFSRQGIGSNLAYAALRRARRSLASEIWVNTQSENHPAVSLYESLGFARAATRLLVLTKKLGTTPPGNDAS
jgi:ribosomal protein S18 acetylase RimI-like enzyme